MDAVERSIHTTNRSSGEQECCDLICSDYCAGRRRGRNHALQLEKYRNEEEGNGFSTLNDGVAMNAVFQLLRNVFQRRNYSYAMVRVPERMFFVAIVLYSAVGSVSPANAQDIWPRHYPPYNGANPRPDLIPRGLYNAWVPYRKAYNRPTYVGGLIAHTIEPSSQEAMSWEENHANGMYRTHCPTPIKMYYYPKPWEVLNVGVRPSGEKKDDQFKPEQQQNDLIPENPEPAVQRY